MKEKMAIRVWGDYLREAINRGIAIIQGHTVMILPTPSLIVSHTVVILSTFQINVSEDRSACLLLLCWL